VVPGFPRGGRGNFSFGLWLGGALLAGVALLAFCLAVAVVGELIVNGPEGVQAFLARL
jgi:hypothetical protein